MSSIGKLRHRMALQQYYEVQDSTFKNVPNFVTITTLFAEIEDYKGRVFFNGQQTDKTITHKIKIRYQPNVTSENWLQMDSRRFRIRRVRDTLERHRFLELDCEEMFLGTQSFTASQNSAGDSLRNTVEGIPLMLLNWYTLLTLDGNNLNSLG